VKRQHEFKLMEVWNVLWMPEKRKTWLQYYKNKTKRINISIPYHTYWYDTNRRCVKYLEDNNWLCGAKSIMDINSLLKLYKYAFLAFSLCLRSSNSLDNMVLFFSDKLYVCCFISSFKDMLFAFVFTEFLPLPHRYMFLQF